MVKKPTVANSSTEMNPRLRRTWILFCFGFFAALAFWQACTTSPTYDESGHLTAAYLQTHGRPPSFAYDLGHPPLLRRLFALPLEFLNVRLPQEISPRPADSTASLQMQPVQGFYFFSALFVFANATSPETLVLAARCMNILLGLLLGFWLWKWAVDWQGETAGLFALGLWATEPNLIAHGALVTTDLGGVCGAVGFSWSACRLLQNPSALRLWGTGILLGLALTAKFSNVVLVPFWILAAFFWRARERSWVLRLKLVFETAVAAWLTVAAVYGFQGMFAPHVLLDSDFLQLGWPFWAQQIYSRLPLPDDFLRGLASIGLHNHSGHGAFLLGEYAQRGWWYYFPTALLLKTHFLWPLLLLGGLALAAKKDFTEKPQGLWALALGGVVLSSLMASSINIGVRHAMLLLPLAGLFLSAVLAKLWAAGEFKKRAAFACLIVMFAELLWVSPHHLAFFNWVAGGGSRGIRYLSDSNLDWGQDLPGLAQFLEQQKNAEVILSYFGTSLPEHYNIRAQNLLSIGRPFLVEQHINSVRPAKEFLAVSATNLQATYFADHHIFDFLKDKNPAVIIGHSIYVYDVTYDHEAQEALLALYQRTQSIPEATRQTQRLAALSN